MERVKLQEFMNRKGMTQQQLADLIGVKRELVGAWNTGRSDITRENLAKLFDAGMFFEEAFGDINILSSKTDVALDKNDSLEIVLNAFQQIIDAYKKEKKA